jgi:peptidoglycan hydrolase-like protein with peptidoglycan-binding domain
MRTTLIALAAAAALAMPAAAQQEQNANQPQDQNQSGKATDQEKSSQGQGMRPSRSQTRLLQHQLNRLGFDAGPSDGIMGTKTKQALEKFQNEKGLNANGQLDRQTMSALRATRGQTASARRSKQGGSPQPQNQPDQNAPK